VPAGLERRLTAGESGGSDHLVDIIVAGGTVLDGCGSEPVRSDVAIQGDRIVAVGERLPGYRASVVIDAHGLRVAPGFIDIHTHSDISVHFNPGMASMVSQGVTTQVVGNCSLCLGLALDDSAFAFERRWLSSHGVKITWSDMAGHLGRVEDDGVATNYVMLAGHGTIRKRVMGMAGRAAGADEIERMKAIALRAMEQGAWGLSTGLEYQPSSYAGVEELAAVSSVMREYGGFYATHLRNEGDLLLEAVREAIQVGEEAGVPVQLSHHKAEGRQNWGKVHETLKLVEAARARGVDIQMDQYPYTAFMTSMSIQFLPDWALEGDADDVGARLRDPGQRARVREAMLANRPDWADDAPGGVWGDVRIGASRDNPALQGRTIAELAAERGVSCVDTTLDLIASARNFISAVNFAISEEDIAVVMRHPWTMIGSDAVGTAPVGKMAEEKVHPRCYGTFPRVLGRYCREKGLLSEAAAVQKMTQLPASRLGLDGRGLLRPGYFADLVVYDPETIGDANSYEDPHQFSHGIDTVLVNGRVAWQDGAETGVRSGRALRRPSP
jgi:N-acyl-D-amino-acid deacylase